ncbi:MAG TPA: NUDIX hydrolase [Bacteroidia bacterium]|jgi:8-oxo-dGTP pyrophosphatase MutT (NUDIX family)
MAGIKKWELLKEEDLSPSRWYPLFRHEVRLPNGHVMDDYYISKLGDVAMIIPVTKRGDLILVRQYKHGIREITLEFPAGIIEPGQTPLDAAYAELEQETGVQAKNIVLLGELRSLPSKNFSRLFGFIAFNAMITTDQQLDVSEEIEVVTLSLRDTEEKIMSGEINCSDTVALYTLYKLKYFPTKP